MHQTWADIGAMTCAARMPSVARAVHGGTREAGHVLQTAVGGVNNCAVRGVLYVAATTSETATAAQRWAQCAEMPR